MTLWAVEYDGSCGCGGWSLLGLFETEIEAQDAVAELLKQNRYSYSMIDINPYQLGRTYNA